MTRQIKKEVKATNSGNFGEKVRKKGQRQKRRIAGQSG